MSEGYTNVHCDYDCVGLVVDIAADMHTQFNCRTIDRHHYSRDATNPLRWMHAFAQVASLAHILVFVWQGSQLCSANETNGMLIENSSRVQ
jgi:hypothetical protein